MKTSLNLKAFAAQLEIFAGLTEAVDALVARHQDSRKDWFPAELVDFGGEDGLELMRQLRARARGLSPAIRVAVALNMLTEEGLPHFHRIITEHFGDLPAFERWTALWTAEEDRHGNVLRDYVRDAALYDMGALDRLQFEFVNAGFKPDWFGSPYRLLAYTSLQERATQMSHANTARLAAAEEPLLQRVLAHLAADEARHCAFYKDAFALALAADTDQALIELARVAPALSMPGRTIPGFAMMAEVQNQAGIFGPREYSALVTELLGYWGIDRCRPDQAEAREAQDKLLALPERLVQLADRLAQRSRRKSFRFAFLRDALVEFA